MMDYDELDRLITTKLNERGLGEYLVKEKSVLLDFPEEYLAEIVLNDAGRIDEANQALAEVAAQLNRENQKLDYIVRSLWDVEEVKLAPDSTPEAIANLMSQGVFSLRFVATLKSGERVRKEVGVEVAPSAYEELRRLGQPTDENFLKDLVRDYLRLQLSFGGESYWDPMKYPRQRVNDGAVLHLHYHPVPAEKGANQHGQREV
jgi:hypothetical protein